MSRIRTSVVLLCCCVACAACVACGDPATPRGRLDGDAPVPVAERRVGEIPGPLSTTPVDTHAVTTTPPTADAEVAPSTRPTCDTAPAAFVPGAVEGYEVEREDSSALSVLGTVPTMQGLVAVRVLRRDGAVARVVAASAAAYAIPGVSDADAVVLVLRSVGLQGEPTLVALGSGPAATGRSASGDTVYAWLPCRNVAVAVFGRDPAMVGDVARRVAG